MSPPPADSTKLLLARSSSAPPVDTDVQLTTRDGRDIHNAGHGTYLFRLVDGAWKVVHTQSGSRPVG